MTNKRNNEEFDEDFDLDDAYLDTDETYIDDYDEDIEENNAQNTPRATARPEISRKKTSGLSFNTMVILGAVVIGVTVLLFNVMSKTADKKATTSSGDSFQSSINLTTVLDDASQKATGDANSAQVPSGPSVAQNDQDGGLLENPDALVDARSDQVSDTGDQAGDSGELQHNNILTPLPENAVKESSPTVNKAQDILNDMRQSREDSSVSVQSENTEILNPVFTAASNTAPADSIAEPVSPQMSQNDLATSIAALMNRMDDLEKKIDSMDNRSEDVAALRREIDALQREAKSSEKKIMPQTTANTQAVASKPAAKKKQTKPAASSKPARVVTKEAPVSSATWQLRAAQPGRAWVSRPGEKDMQTVEVGQNLQGIGRVQSIVYQGGVWIVQGTNGNIRQ